MALRIASVTPFTTLDFPGHMAAILWCRGCPLDCGYCHNPDLRPACAGANDPGWETVMTFLHRRRGVLDGVVFSGGEPLTQRALPDAMQEIRALGYRTALHTAGTSPVRLSAALPLCDWVGFDAKAPFDRYETVTGVRGSGARALESLDILLESGAAHEVRTTFDTALLNEEDLLELANTLAGRGVRVYRLQEVSGMPRPVSTDLVRRLGALFPDFEIRRAVAAPRPARGKPAPDPAKSQYPPSGARAA